MQFGVIKTAASRCQPVSLIGELTCSSHVELDLRQQSTIMVSIGHVFNPFRIDKPILEQPCPAPLSWSGP